MKDFIFFFIGFLFFCHTCKATEWPIDKDSLPQEIYKYWSHSYEENGKEWKAYRPDDFDFPPSRGREGFEIKKNGLFLFYQIAPTDGLLTIEGAWETTEKDIVKVTFVEKDHAPMVFKIISIENDLLKIKWLE
jgi:hypothetical protein